MVVPSGSEESSVDASLRYASLCMTDRENVDTSLRCAPFSMTGDVIPSQSEASSAMWGFTAFSRTGDRKTSSDFDHDHRHVVMLRRVSDEALHVFANCLHDFVRGRFAG